jgi:hypothetical protein
MFSVRLVFASWDRISSCQPSKPSFSFTDQNGVTHTVTVAGESLYTVAAAAIRQFRKTGLEPRDAVL